MMDGFRQDAEALARDWAMVRRDLETAMEVLRQRQMRRADFAAKVASEIMQGRAKRAARRRLMRRQPYREFRRVRRG